ncbi:MAG: molecular chaperone DnaJ [Ruminococcaceae bacterium]|nr:molecular chaperone DnaJ [Oscillospiraceae bacterium]
MADNKRDYYEVLGLSKGASDDEIKKSYRKLAKQYHPDLNPGDAEAEKNFKEVNEAYSVLSDADKKAKYDQYGHAAFDPAAGGGSGFGGFGGFGGMDFDVGDIFSSFFGGGGSARRSNGPVQGNDREARVTLTFEEAAFGAKKEIIYNRVEKCQSCDGSGAAAGTSPKTCSKCGGTGSVRVQQRTPFGMMQSTRPCQECHGSGKIIEKPCPDCRGSGTTVKRKTLEVNIPAGIADGQEIVARGQGDVGKNGGLNGDLYINVHVKEHSVFVREGSDIFCDVPITFVEAALGATIKVPTLEGDIDYEIPEGTQTGSRFTLREKGMPSVSGKRRGNLTFKVIVDVPKNLNAKQKDMLRDFAKTCGEKNNLQKEGFAEKMRKLFNGKK